MPFVGLTTPVGIRLSFRIPTESKQMHHLVGSWESSGVSGNRCCYTRLPKGPAYSPQAYTQHTHAHISTHALQPGCRMVLRENKCCSQERCPRAERLRSLTGTAGGVRHQETGRHLACLHPQRDACRGGAHILHFLKKILLIYF